ncbi:MAG: MDR family MFS transporter [Coleofasciculaceae cyanobacterium]
MTNTTAINKSNPKPAPEVGIKTWIGLMGAMIGAFMAVLDIQITNSSLQEIQAALGATIEEGSWISTAYLVAEVVVIPLTGWLSQVFSIRRYLLVNTALFIFFSICCAWAVNLPMMIVFRGLQGFTGGILIPMALTIVLMTLPPAKQPIGMAMFAITATFAPSIGPTLGGWLTDNLGWQYNFYLNIIPGLLMLSAIAYAIPAKPMQLNLLKGGDWWGIFSMAVGLASLEVVLEEGNRKDWFFSPEISQLAVMAFAFLSAFLWIELTRRRPFINLKLLRRQNFGIGSFAGLTLGLGLYGSIYILPLYLVRIQNYTAMQIGEVIMWSGVPQLFLIPLVPKLMQRIDARYLAAVGFSLFAFSCFMNSNMTHDTAIDQLRWSQLVRAIGQPIMIVPLTSIATGGIEPEQAGSASGLFNMIRNLGGSIGIAILSTLLSWREQFHSNRIGESVSLFDPVTQQRIEQLTQSFVSRGSNPILAHDQAIAAIDNLVRREAFVMAFNDCFYFVGIALLVSGITLLFAKKVKPGAGAAAH